MSKRRGGRGRERRARPQSLSSQRSLLKSGDEGDAQGLTALLRTSTSSSHGMGSPWARAR